MISTTMRKAARVAGLGLLAFVSPTLARAQWGATAYGVGEVDTKSTVLLLAGLTASPKGHGLQPMVGAQGYFLSYKSGSTTTSVTTLRPYVGAKNGFEGGEAYGTVGYAFTNRNAPAVSASTSDIGSGMVVSGGLDYWGTGGPWGYQALGSWNFGSQSYWARGRATTRLGTSTGPAQTRVGGEVAVLGGSNYHAIQPGAVLEFHDSQNRILGLGAGGKFFNGGGSAVYFKVEGSMPVIR